MTAPTVTPRRRPAKPGHRYATAADEPERGVVKCRDCGSAVFNTPADLLAHDRLHIRLDQLAARLEQLAHDLRVT